MKNHDYAAELHEAVLKASTSSDSNVRAAYFNLAEFYYRHAEASTRSQHDAGVLTKLAKKCCREQHCWCKGHDDENR